MDFARSLVFILFVYLLVFASAADVHADVPLDMNVYAITVKAKGKKSGAAYDHEKPRRHSLGVKGDSIANDADIEQVDYFAHRSQQWRLEAHGDYYTIVNRNSGKCLDVDSESLEENKRIIQWDWWGGNNQRWAIEHVDDGYYRIKAKHSGKYLTVKDVQDGAGATLVQRSWHAHESQLFRFDNITHVLTRLPMSLDLYWSTPTITKCEDYYYGYFLNPGIGFRKSKNLKDWSNAGSVLGSPGNLGEITWWRDEVPTSDGSAWAPDIVYINGKYHLYYSISSMGSRNSAIGLFTNKTLDPGDTTDYQWEDKGIVFKTDDSMGYNAIDPSVIVDPTGDIWMSFGSGWDGIMVVKLDEHGMVPDESLDTNKKLKEGSFYRLAVATNLFINHPSAGTFSEAPILFYRGGWYYLSISHNDIGHWESGGGQYAVKIGRSKNITGPYYDREGRMMFSPERVASDSHETQRDKQGGTFFFRPYGNISRLGHHCMFKGEGGVDYYSFEYTYVRDKGMPYSGGGIRGMIVPIHWVDGWPIAAKDEAPKEVLDEVYTIKNSNSNALLKMASKKPTEKLTLGAGVAEENNFKLIDLHNGYHKIVSVHSGHTFAPVGGSHNPNAEIDQFFWGGGDGQQWRIRKLNNGRYEIANRASGHVLGVNGVNSVVQQAWTGDESQQWKLTDVDNFQLADGVYQIQLTDQDLDVVDPNLGLNRQYWKVLGIQNKSTVAETELVVHDYVMDDSLNGDYQHFYFERLSADGVSPGIYRIRVLHTNMWLGNKGGLDDKVDQYNQWFGSGGGQKWEIENLHGGLFRIKNVDSGKVLDLDNGSTAAGTSVVQNTVDVQSESQKWRLVEVLTRYDLAEGTYVIKTTDGSGRVLEIENADIGNNKKLVLSNVASAASNEAIHQRFNVLHDGFDGVYHILADHSDKALGVGGTTGTDTVVDQFDWFGGVGQYWRFVRLDDGKYKIMHAQFNLALSITEDNGVKKIELKAWANEAGQKWELAEAPSSP
ncbi:RICIN domain-containing protein [Poriferisphaera sp. WC338]|uniref:RICIN domain-containing protein n=1 Tax=Poriferisphaera sp. WC338 TaxID=3425129 RepID=UPI003D81AE05